MRDIISLNIWGYIGNNISTDIWDNIWDNINVGISETIYQNIWEKYQ